MTNKQKIFPQKLVDMMSPILVKGENIVATFRESFDWNLSETWAVCTTYRMLIIDVLPWRIDVEDFHLKNMNLEYKTDNIGPYDMMEFKSMEKDLYGVSIIRNRRKEAKKFFNAVSTNIRLQDIYGHRQVFEDQHEEFHRNEASNGSSGGNGDNGTSKSNGSGNGTSGNGAKKKQRCLDKAKNLEMMGAITEKEYQEEKVKCNEDKK